MIKPERALARFVSAGLALLAGGCSVVPKSRLDDAAKVTRVLRAENAQLKDTALTLKGENNDLTQRAIDDGRKIVALEDANGRLSTSVQAYIDEREDLNDAFQRFKRQAQATSASPPSTAMTGRLKAFASAREGTTYDGPAGVVSVVADRLFVPGTDQLLPGASRWIDDCAALLGEGEARGWPLVVAGHANDSPVRRTSLGGEAATSGDLSLARAIRVRDALAERAGRDPSRIGVAGYGTSRPIVSGPDDRARSRNARIEIELAPSPTVADSAHP